LASGIWSTCRVPALRLRGMPVGNANQFPRSLSHRSSRACQQVSPVETNRRNSSLNQGVTVIADFLPSSHPQISNPRSPGSLRSRLCSIHNRDRELGSRQLTSRTLKTPPIGHFYEFLCRTPFLTANRRQGSAGLFGREIQLHRVALHDALHHPFNSSFRLVHLHPEDP
jgi:hypothetical protein